MKTISYKLSDGDIKAIVAALPIALEFDLFMNTSKIQSDLNKASIESAGVKLLNKNLDLTPNEIRVIGLAVGLATAFLTDPDSLDFELDEDSMHAIQPYIFTYQKLDPIFRQALA